MAELVLPEAERGALEQAVEGVKEALGARLCSLTAYGSAARGQFVRGRSDLNLLVVLTEASPDVLRSLREALAKARESLCIEPYVVRKEELALLAREFPARLWDMRRSYVVLCGDDVLAALNLEPKAIAARAEQELLNAAIRLRRAIATPVEARWGEVLHRFLRAFTKGLRFLWLGATGEHVEDRTELIQRAATRWGLNERELLHLSAWRAGALDLTEDEARAALDILLDALDRLVGRHE